VQIFNISNITVNPLKHSGNLYVPSNSVNNPAFCPQSVFMETVGTIGTLICNLNAKQGLVNGAQFIICVLNHNT
jgi:hypothetical protein